MSFLLSDTHTDLMYLPGPPEHNVCTRLYPETDLKPQRLYTEVEGALPCADKLAMVPNRVPVTLRVL